MKVTSILNNRVQPYCNRTFFLLILLIISVNANSQSRSIRDSDSLELDSSIRYGRLANGFTYYIKDLVAPQPKLYMNLYSQAGANHSGKNEPNIAHAVEHMAYKATKNFPEGIDHSEMEDDLGLTIYDLQAVTSTKLTEYFFDAPADNTKGLDVGLLFFRDIADGLLMKDRDIQSVKGELRQEYLLKTQDKMEYDAKVKLASKMYPCSQDLSNFLSKQEKMDPATVRKFYKDFYRPDLLAISIIGNIEDIDEIELKIKRVFSDLNSPDHPKQLKNCDSMYYSRPPVFSVVERDIDSAKVVPKEAVKIQLRYRDPNTFYNLSNKKGIKGVILIDLLEDILDRRFLEISKGYTDFTVFNLNLYKEDMLPGLATEAEVKASKVKETLQKIISSTVQLQKYGVSKEEFEKVKADYSDFLNSINEKNHRYWRDQIVAHYIIGEALPNQKKLLQQDILSNLTLEEFNRFSHNFLSSGPQDIGIIAPSGNEALFLEEEEVRSWIQEQENSQVSSFSYSKVPKNILHEAQKNDLKEKVRYRVKSISTEIKEFDLENGLKLVVQTVEPKAQNDQGKFVLNGFSRRGACALPQEQFFSALYAPEIVLHSGVNNLSRLKVDQYLNEKGVSTGAVSFYVGKNESGIQASGRVDEVETVLQLLYLYITEPNKNKAAFREWQQERLRSYNNMAVNHFHEAVKEKTADLGVIDEVFGKKVLVGGTKMIKGVEEVDFDEALETFRTFFGNAKDFTIVISGDFEIDSISPVIIKYLGNFPSGTSKEINCSDHSKKKLSSGPQLYYISPPPKVDLHNVKYGWKFVKDAKKSDDWREQLQVEVLAELTNIRGWDLRFKKGYSIYDVRVVGDYNKDLERYEVRSYLDLVPEQYPVVKAEMHEIFKELKTELVSDEDLEKAIKYVISNRYHLDGSSRALQKRNERLYDHYRYDLPLVRPTEMKSYLNSITAKEMREFARKLYQKKYLYEFVMRENNVN